MQSSYSTWLLEYLKQVCFTTKLLEFSQKNNPLNKTPFDNKGFHFTIFKLQNILSLNLDGMFIHSNNVQPPNILSLN
jgi:hypothetical protein